MYCMYVGDAIGTIKELVLARNHSAVLTNSGRVYVWGESTFGRLGISESNRYKYSKYARMYVCMSA
jgi:alpha-tubulin suppressor-like RCC1 family protein